MCECQRQDIAPPDPYIDQAAQQTDQARNDRAMHSLIVVMTIAKEYGRHDNRCNTGRTRTAQHSLALGDDKCTEQQLFEERSMRLDQHHHG